MLVLAIIIITEHGISPTLLIGNLSLSVASEKETQ
jgi:hypothetical protein